MSTWKCGKLQINCSINVLRRALVNIMPEWEEHIRIDEECKLPCYDYTGNPNGKYYHIIVPGARHPGMQQSPNVIYNDIGLTREKDGTWTLTVDESGFNKIANLEGNIKGEIARMKAKALAQSRGHTILEDQNDEFSSRTVIRIPTDDLKHYA